MQGNSPHFTLGSYQVIRVFLRVKNLIESLCRSSKFGMIYNAIWLVYLHTLCLLLGNYDLIVLATILMDVRQLPLSPFFHNRDAPHRSMFVLSNNGIIAYQHRPISL